MKTIRLLVCMTLLFFVFTESKGNETYYYYKATAASSPTGAGKVYVNNSNTKKEQTEVSGKDTEKTATVYLWAEPSEDYYFVNWLKGTSVVSEEPDFSTNVTVTSTTEGSPTTTAFTAQFTRVKARPNDAELGSVTLNKDVNEVGDELTLTAVANTTNRGSFVNWTKEGSDEVLGTDAVLTVTVSGKAMYVANFEKESIVAGTFGIRNRATSNYIRALDRCTFKTTASHPFITYFNIGLDEAKELNALSFYVNGVSTNVNVFTQFIKVAIELTQNQQLAETVLGEGVTASALKSAATSAGFNYLAIEPAADGFVTIAVDVPNPTVVLDGVEDIWTWAKRQAVAYMDGCYVDTKLHDCVVSYLNQLQQGKKNYLTEQTGAIVLTDDATLSEAQWELDNPELVAPSAATGNLIKNAGTGKYLISYGDIYSPMLTSASEVASKTTFALANVANDKAYQLTTFYSTNANPATLNQTTGAFAYQQAKFEAFMSNYVKALTPALQNATANYVGKGKYWTNTNERNTAITTPVTSANQNGWIYQSAYLRTRCDDNGKMLFFHTVPALPDAFVNGLMGCGLIAEPEEAWPWLRERMIEVLPSVNMTVESKSFVKDFYTMVTPDNTYYLSDAGESHAGYVEGRTVDADTDAMKWAFDTRANKVDYIKQIVGDNICHIFQNKKTGKYVSYDPSTDVSSPDETDVFKAQDYLVTRQAKSNVDVTDVSGLFSFSKENGKAHAVDNVNYAAQLAYALMAADVKNDLTLDDAEGMYNKYATHATLHLIASGRCEFYAFTYIPVLPASLDEKIEGGAWNWIKQNVVAQGYSPLPDGILPGNIYFLAAENDQFSYISASAIDSSEDALVWNCLTPRMHPGQYYRVISKYGYGDRKAIGVSAAKGPTSVSTWGMRYLGCLGLVPPEFYPSHPGTVLVLEGKQSQNVSLDVDGYNLQNINFKAQDVETSDNMLGKYKADLRNSLAAGLFHITVNGGGYMKSMDGSANTWKVKYYMGGGSNSNHQYGYCDFDVQPLDEAHMDQYYFGAQPSADCVLEKDGGQKYYTTMYTTFPYECRDGVKAYYVDKISDGKVHCVPIASAQIPSHTPVILECNATTPAKNRLLPLVDEPSALDIKDNLLVGELKLRQSEWAAEETYRTEFDAKTMRVLGGKHNATFANQNVPDYFITNYWPIGNNGADGGKDDDNNFTKASTTEPGTYLTNNTAYLIVDEDTPAELELSFEDLPLEPVEGYYRLKNGDGKYLAVTGDQSSPSLATETDGNQLGTIFSLSLSPLADNSGYAVNALNAQGADISEILGGSLTFPLAEDGVSLMVKSEKDGAVSYLGPEASLTEVGALWTLEEVGEVNVKTTKVSFDASGDTQKYVATLYTDFAYTLGNAFKAYVVGLVDDKDGSKDASLTKLSANDEELLIVPARTGVLIAKDAQSDDDGTSGILTLTPLYGDETDFAGENLLSGTCLAIPYDSETMYVLGRNAEKIAGFRTYSGEKVASNKSFLVLPAGTEVKGGFLSFNFNGGTTGLRPIATDGGEEMGSSWYSPTGVLFNEKPARKGVYIHNGKKIMIK